MFRKIAKTGIVVTMGLFIFICISLSCAKKEESIIKIGAVLPLTGDIAEYGIRCKKGIDVAVEEINSAGGIKGKKIQIIYEDSKGIPKEGVSALQKLISIDKVQAVIGAVASSVSLAMVPVADKNKVVLFSPASSSPKLTGISRYFFRNWPSDVFEASTMAEYVFVKMGLRKIAILYVNNDYGLGLKNEFEKKFEEMGGEIVLVESYEQNDSDFRTQLTKIKSRNPDAIYLAGYHKEMAFATKQIRELGLKAQILADADYAVAELLKIAGGSAEGAIFATPEYDPNSENQPVKEFAEKFRRTYGNDPSIFEANGYDALKIITKAISEGAKNGEEIAQKISNLKDYPGASGLTSYDKNGEVIKPATIKTVRNGQFVQLSER